MNSLPLGIRSMSWTLFTMFLEVYRPAGALSCRPLHPNSQMPLLRHMATSLNNSIVRSTGGTTRETTGSMKKPSMLTDLEVISEGDPTIVVAVPMGGTTPTAIPTIRAATSSSILLFVIKETLHFEVVTQAFPIVAEIDATILLPFWIPIVTSGNLMLRSHSCSFNATLFVIRKLPTMLLLTCPSTLFGRHHHHQSLLRS